VLPVVRMPGMGGVEATRLSLAATPHALRSGKFVALPVHPMSGGPSLRGREVDRWPLPVRTTLPVRTLPVVAGTGPLPGPIP
jgi:hypothetical protein